jgi:hypothetical protein
MGMGSAAAQRIQLERLNPTFEIETLLHMVLQLVTYNLPHMLL